MSHRLSGSGVSQVLDFPTGVVPISWRFTFKGPDNAGGGTATVPDVLVPHSTPDPILATSDPVPVAGIWTVSFFAVDATGSPIGPVIEKTIEVAAQVQLRVAKDLLLQVIVG